MKNSLVAFILIALSFLFFITPSLFGGEPNEELIEVRGPSESYTYRFWFDVPECLESYDEKMPLVHAIERDKLKVAKIAAILDRDVVKTIVKERQGKITKYYLAISETITLNRRDLEYLAFQCDTPNPRTGVFDCIAMSQEIDLTMRRAERLLWALGPDVIDLPDFKRVRNNK